MRRDEEFVSRECFCINFFTAQPWNSWTPQALLPCRTGIYLKLKSYKWSRIDWASLSIFPPLFNHLTCLQWCTTGHCWLWLRRFSHATAAKHCAEARQTADLTHTGEKSRGTTQRFPSAGKKEKKSNVLCRFCNSLCSKFMSETGSDCSRWRFKGFLYLARHIEIGKSTPFPMPKSICNSER